MLAKGVIVTAAFFALAATTVDGAESDTREKGTSAASTAQSDGDPIGQAKAALAAKRYKEARDLFLRSAASNPKDYVALHGAGVASLYLRDSKQANKLLEQAISLAPVADRAMSYNYAVSDLGLGNYRRAAKTLMDYLYANPDGFDEPLLNALGVCLNQIGVRETASRDSDETRKFYSLLVSRFEEKRPGMKRWGTKWVTAADAEARATRVRDMETQLALLAKDVSETQGRVDQRHKELQDARSGHGIRSAKQVEVMLTGEEHELADKKRKYDRAAAEIDAIRPEYPQLLLPIAMDERTPPPFPGEFAATAGPTAGPTALTAAGSSGATTGSTLPPAQAIALTAGPPVHQQEDALRTAAHADAAQAVTHSPQPHVVTPLRAARDVTVDAKEGVSGSRVSLGPVMKGQRVSFQYVRGQWSDVQRRAFPPASPDDVPVAHNCVLPLRFCEKSNNQVIELGTVPGGTKNKPYVYVADHDIAELVLNCNDPTPANNVGDVTYRITIDGP